MAYVDLCALSDVLAERGSYVTHGSRALAVFRLPDGSVRVTDDACPHAGGSLSAGRIEPHPDAGDTPCVICPWHAWPFKLSDGRCPDNPVLRLRTYPARIRNGRVEAILE